MDHSLHRHHQESPQDLPEDIQDFCRREGLLLGLEVAEIAEGTVLHYDLHFLLFLIEVVVVDLQQVGMGELLHQLDLLHCLFHLKRVHFDLLQGETFLTLILDQIDASETTLPDHLHCLVGLHDMIIRSSKLGRGRRREGREGKEGGKGEEGRGRGGLEDISVILDYGQYTCFHINLLPNINNTLIN